MSLITASWDKTIKELDVESGQCLKTHKGHLKGEKYPGDAGEKLKTYDNKIEMIDGKTIINIPGLFIQGCSFKNLHPDSDLSEESKNLMRQYGAKI